MNPMEVNIRVDQIVAGIMASIDQAKSFVEGHVPHGTQRECLIQAFVCASFDVQDAGTFLAIERVKLNNIKRLGKPKTLNDEAGMIQPSFVRSSETAPVVAGAVSHSGGNDG